MLLSRLSLLESCSVLELVFGVLCDDMLMLGLMNLEGLEVSSKLNFEALLSSFIFVPLVQM